MGHAGSKQLSVVLRTDAQKHLRKLGLKKEVADMVKGWQEDGAALGLTLEMFKQLLSLNGDAALMEELFRTFDTDENQKVDAFEVLAACTFLALGPLDDKVEALFAVFDFSGAGRLNFDEVNILLASVCRGLAKACCTPMEDDEALVQATRQSFDCHNLPYDKQITKEQLKRWVRHDVEAVRLVEAFHGARSIADVEEALAEREIQQAEAFQELCPEGEAEVSVDHLLGSPALRRALGDPPEDDFRGLLQAMCISEGASVAAGRFAQAARAWNSFHALDGGKEGSLPLSDLPLLLWLCQPERSGGAPRHAAGDALERLRASLGLPAGGRLALLDWVGAWLRAGAGSVPGAGG